MDTLNVLLDQIEELPADRIWMALEAAIERYRILFPGQEILVLSVPKKDASERKRRLRTLQDHLKDYE